MGQRSQKVSIRSPARNTPRTVKRQPVARRPRKAGSEPVDELDVTRGQNAEKGNTTKPENVRDEGYVAH